MLPLCKVFDVNGSVSQVRYVRKLEKSLRYLLSGRAMTYLGTYSKILFFSSRDSCRHRCRNCSISPIGFPYISQIVSNGNSSSTTTSTSLMMCVSAPSSMCGFDLGFGLGVGLGWTTVVVHRCYRRVTLHDLSFHRV